MPRVSRTRMKRGVAPAAGPVHRAGPTWHDPALWEVEDAALYLMAPADDFNRRVRRLMRAAALMVASVAMTPALPVLVGLA